MKNSKVFVGVCACVSILALSAVALSRGGGHGQVAKVNRFDDGNVHLIGLYSPGDGDVVRVILAQQKEHPGRTFTSSFTRPNDEVCLIFIGQ